MCFWIYIFRRRVKLRQAPECLRDEVEPWRRRGGLRLVDFEEKVEGRTYVVKAEGPGPRGGCWRTAGVEGARREYAIAFGRRVADDATVSYAYAGAGVFGGRRGEAFGAGGGTG